MTPERDFQAAIIQLAQRTGWLTNHVYDSRRSSAGWVDLVLVHPERAILILWEVKSERGVVRSDQARWLGALAGISTLTDRVISGVVRPADWDRIAAILQGAG